jgi:hypothetical protein
MSKTQLASVKTRPGDIFREANPVRLHCHWYSAGQALFGHDYL